mmetsp:Transcript_86991/g.130436  ORF Transcript_86991/g.130436 Transcript_86991/m.130436 type:complete len:109 (-) Transcript_86991:344-670(-)
MNTVVHDDKENPRWRCSDIGMPTVKEDCDVVVPVEKNEGLLVDNDEEGINELRKFAENEKLNPQSSRARPIGRPWVQAKIVAKRHKVEIVYQVGQSSEHPKPREETQT